MIQKKLSNNLKKIKIFLVGDFFLDEYIYGEIKRFSPEAPVPIVNVIEKKINLGGAGNVFNNLINLGVKVSVLGKVGNDKEGIMLLEMLKKKKTVDNLIQIQKNSKTIKKTRILDKQKQMIRIDDEYIKNYNFFNKDLKNKIKKNILNSSLVIISDYGKGFCTKKICKFIIQFAKINKIQVVVDPRKNYSDYSKYINSNYITPNLNELRMLFPKIKNTDKDILISSRRIIKRYRIKNVIATRSEKGISFTNDTKNINMKTQAKKIFDVSGAGDTVVAVFSVLLSLRIKSEKCLNIANKCAGIVISKKGTKPIEKKEFLKLIKM